MTPRRIPDELDELTPIFSIAAAAELAGMHPQTLRQYDRLGLVQPGRTAGNTRRYSMRDVALLRQVQLLSSEGVSLEGIRRILDLQDEVQGLRERVRELESALASEVVQRDNQRVFAAGTRGVTTIRFGVRPSAVNEIVVWRKPGDKPVT